MGQLSFGRSRSASVLVGNPKAQGAGDDRGETGVRSDRVRVDITGVKSGRRGARKRQGARRPDAAARREMEARLVPISLASEAPLHFAIATPIVAALSSECHTNEPTTPSTMMTERMDMAPSSRKSPRLFLAM